MQLWFRRSFLARVAGAFGLAVACSSAAWSAPTVNQFNAVFAPPPPPVPGVGFVAVAGTAGAAVQVAGDLGGIDADPSTTPLNFFRIVPDAAAGGTGTIGFNRIPSNTGAWDALQIDWDIRINDPVTGADGVSFMYLNTANWGNSGAAPAVSEEANAAGSLGVSFDTWNNGNQDDNDPGRGDGSLPDSFSLHFNGTQRGLSVTMADLGLVDSWIENGNTKHATLIAIPNPAGGTDVSFAVTDLVTNEVAVPFANVNIPDMVPYDGRLGFAGRVGGENQNADIDNLTTTFTPAGGAPFTSLVQDFDFVPPPPPPPPSPFGGTPYVKSGTAVETENPPPVGGPQNGRLRLTDDAGGQDGRIGFDQTSTGPNPTIIASFDIRLADTNPGNGIADGGAFVLMDAGLNGATGPVPNFTSGVAEEPNLPGAFAVGFDTFVNAGEGGNDMSVHWNNNLITNRILNATTEVNLLNGQYNHVDIVIQQVGGDSQVDIAITDATDGSVTTVFSGLIPGMLLNNHRAGFSARTGGAAQLFAVDNVNIQFIPEPSTWVLSVLAVGGVLAAKRRRQRA